MKAKFKVTIFIVALSIFISLFSAIVVLADNREEERADADTETGVYTIKELDGRIGVFYMDDLIYFTDIEVDTLPSSDRILLHSGIETESYESVVRLLEDYST
jgi:hypothetical protein